MLDFANPVMNISGGLVINGTIAHVHIFNITGIALTGDLHLVNPNDGTVVSAAIQATGIVLMTDVDLAINGTWRVENDLGNDVTQFDILIWNGTNEEIRNDLVMLFPDAENFLGDFKTLYAEGCIDDPQSYSIGSLTANSNPNSVIASAATGLEINVDDCGSGVHAHFINATAINIDLEQFDEVLRVILTYQSPPGALENPQETRPGCAALQTLETPSYPDSNTPCLMYVGGGRHYVSVLAIVGVFEAPLMPETAYHITTGAYRVVG